MMPKTEDKREFVTKTKKFIRNILNIVGKQS